jgi:hypothetical protein
MTEPINLNFKPIIIDPGKNEWILKQREFAGITAGTTGFYFASPVTEEEFLRNGKKYYRRIIHHKEINRTGDEVEEVEIPRTASRLPGPTNGGLDLDDKSRWILTGSPFPTFRFKQPALDLEVRLRKIILRAIPKVGADEIANDLINMLKDPVTIGLLVAGGASWVALHYGGPPGAAVALALDCISAAVIIVVLGKAAVAFFQALLGFLDAIADAQNDAELDAGAEALAAMIKIVAEAGITIAAAILLKRIFGGLKSKAPGKLGRTVDEVPPKVRKVKPLRQQTGKPLSIVELGRLNCRSLVKLPRLKEALKKVWRDSESDNMFSRREQGGYIVENADGTLDFERWPVDGEINEIQPPPVTGPSGEPVAFFRNRRVRGSVHTHPNPRVNEFGERAVTEPSAGDGEFAKKFNKDTGVEGDNYVIAADGQVYAFDHLGQAARVGSRVSIIGE